jgi:hypothetical protein
VQVATAEEERVGRIERKGGAAEEEARRHAVDAVCACAQLPADPGRQIDETEDRCEDEQSSVRTCTVREEHHRLQPADDRRRDE